MEAKRDLNQLEAWEGEILENLGRPAILSVKFSLKDHENI